MKSENEQIIINSLGDEIKNIQPALLNKNTSEKYAKILNVDPDILAEIQINVEQKLANCSTHREMLEVEINSLAECVGVATELYKRRPVPDFAFQLASLSQAHKSSLQQLERMKDPKAIVGEIESQIRTMFMAIVKAMALEMDKTKKEMIRLNPESKNTVEDLFGRMLNSIQPETQNIYDDLQKNLKRILGIRG